MWQWYQDQKFFKLLLQLAVPLTLQYLLMSSLNAADFWMIGQLNETAIAALGLTDQIFFLSYVAFFGLTSGAGVFVAQYWGNQDIPAIQNVLKITVLIIILLSGVFSFACLLIPELLLGLYSQDKEVLFLGSQYLKIVGWSYLATGITFTFATLLKSMGMVKLPTYMSVFALSLNVVLNYLLIFGHAGFPALGVAGAAIATCISRWIECVLLLVFIYRLKTPLSISFRHWLRFPFHFLPSFSKTVLPVLGNEIIWATGITSYYIIYARMSTESIAAMGILASIERLFFVIFMGIGNACAIMIGNRIGAQEYSVAMGYAHRFIQLTSLLGILLGMLLFGASSWIPQFYEISSVAQRYLEDVLKIAAVALTIKGLNFLFLVGIFRSGGDTRFVLLLDLLGVWGISMPLALVGAFVWGWSIQGVYILVLIEEFLKLGIAFHRLPSKKWIHQLVVRTSN